MKQLAFEHKNQHFWQDFAALLDQLEGVEIKDEAFDNNWPKFPAHYRKMSQFLSVAQSRQYSPVLIDFLHQLVMRGHRHLYRQKPAMWSAFTQLMRQGFPQALRREWRVWLISSCLFYIPAIFMGLMCYFDSEFLYSLVTYEQVQQMEFMYDPSNATLARPEGRESDSDFMMFGFYIFNNISIDFKAYASGLLFGIGSIVLMIFNGLFIGGIAGHLTNKGYIETFWPFVSGHSALELTAATIAGAAGLKLGYSLINPKRFTRALALKQAGIDSFPLICGAGLMTFLAAFVEGFWSATPGVPHLVKYAIGIAAWLALFSYLLLAGRKQ
jgi:uncharacterized membrane protein SpoIIM required for sporulation